MNDLFKSEETPASILSHFADHDAVDSFIAWRKKIRKPLTDRAARMIAKTLQQINAEGGDATEALDMAQERGWSSIKAPWYFRGKEQENEQPNNMAGQQRASSNATDLAIDAAARINRASEGDMF